MAKVKKMIMVEESQYKLVKQAAEKDSRTISAFLIKSSLDRAKIEGLLE